MSRDIVFLAVASCVFIGETTVASDTTPIRLEVSSGTVSFEVATNVPGIGVKGKTNSVTVHVQIESGADGLILRQVEALVPVRGFSTGMKGKDVLVG